MNVLGPTLFLLALAAVSLLPAGRGAHTGPSREPSSAARDDAKPTVESRPKIVPFLWFRKDAEEALRFYTSVFPGAKVLSETRWGEGGPLPKGALLTAEIRLVGQELMLLNGGPAPEFTDAISMFIRCDTQEEIDTYWEKLTAGGGKPGPCGWLKDRFGVSWQVVPARIGTWLGDKDPEKVKRVSAALMQMQKLDIDELQRAFDGR